MTTTTFDPARVQTPSWLGLPGVEEPTEAAATPTVTSFEDEDLFGQPFSTGPIDAIRPPEAAAAEAGDVVPEPVDTSQAEPVVDANDRDPAGPSADSASDDDTEPPTAEAALPDETSARQDTVVLPTATEHAEITPADVTEAEPDQVEESGAPQEKTTATAEELVAAASRYEVIQKIKKFPLIDPDQRWVMFVAIAALGGILAANLGSSFTAVYAMAATVGLPPSFQWLPVVILDVAIVGFSWVLMVFMSRGYEVKRTRFYLITVTTFSVVANFMHTYEHWNGDISTAPAIYGVVFSSSIPLMALAATEELIRLVFIRRHRVAKKKKELA